MNISDRKEYDDLKTSLTLSDFEMFVFLRVQYLIDSYMKYGLQHTRSKLSPYVHDMHWYEMYRGHAEGSKDIWKE